MKPWTTYLIQRFRVLRLNWSLSHLWDFILALFRCIAKLRTYRFLILPACRIYYLRSPDWNWRLEKAPCSSWSWALWLWQRCWHEPESSEWLHQSRNRREIIHRSPPHAGRGIRCTPGLEGTGAESLWVTPGPLWCCEGCSRARWSCGGASADRNPGWARWGGMRGRTPDFCKLLQNSQILD